MGKGKKGRNPQQQDHDNHQEDGDMAFGIADYTKA